MVNGSYLIQLFEFSYGALFRNLEGISHEESVIEPEPGGNCMNWVLGHIVATRNRVLPLVGMPPVWRAELAFMYSGRQEAQWSCDSALDLQNIQTDLARSQQDLRNALEAIPEGKLNAVTGDGRSLGDALGFFHFHESYHGGQIALLRRLLGKQGVIKAPAPRPAPTEV